MVVALPPPHPSAPVGRQSQPPTASGSSRSLSARALAFIERARHDRSLAVKVVAALIIICALMVSAAVRVLGQDSSGPRRGVSIVDRLPVANGGGGNGGGSDGRSSKTQTAASPQSPAALPISPISPTSPTSPVLPPASLPAIAPPSTAPTRIVVHAAGAIANPGVYVFDVGARVADLVTSAGGATGAADIDRLNLAAPLADGTRVYIPFRGKEVPATIALDTASPASPPASPLGGPAPADAPGNTTPTGKLNLNTATAEQLDALPGVGPATAAAIIEHRTKIGRFRSITQLLDVPGIGEAKLAALRTRVAV